MLMKVMSAAVLIGTMACAQEVPVPKLWTYSAVALGTGAGMDLASSIGKPEMNPILRSADGRFGARGAALKVGVVGGMMLAERPVIRRHPGLGRPLTIMNLVVGGLWGGVAIRNWRVHP